MKLSMKHFESYLQAAELSSSSLDALERVVEKKATSRPTGVLKPELTTRHT